jgi:hypothetical protein
MRPDTCIDERSGDENELLNNVAGWLFLVSEFHKRHFKGDSPQLN